MTKLFIIALFLCWGSMATLNANPLEPEKVPGPLKPWIDWSLDFDQSHLCPLDLTGLNRFCAMASPLDLNLNRTAGEFSVTWRVFQPTLVPLPGDEGAWPLDIKVSGGAYQLVQRDSKPYLELNAGLYQVKGRYQWLSRPDTLAVPLAIAKINLVVDDSKRLQFSRRQDGQLILTDFADKKKEVQKEESFLAFKVHRKLVDKVPFELVTHVRMEVGGKKRDVTLENLLHPDFKLVRYSSPLPMRLSETGVPILEARAGVHQLYFYQVGFQAITELKLENSIDQVKDEIWVFEAHPHLRQVKLVDNQTIDPRNTFLPKPWKKLPAYYIPLKKGLAWEVEQTGSSNPPLNKLKLNRNIWLDFDGGGYTIHDLIDGELHQSHRLDLKGPYQLERVSIDREDQFITLSQNGHRGVEVRKKRIQLAAENRINDPVKAWNFGWSEDFKNVAATLHLPPGWLAWHATGVDRISGSFIERWTLFDFFMVFIIVLAISKLWGTKFAAISLITLVLTWHRGGAPQWIWVHVLIASSLTFVLPEGSFRKANRVYLALAQLLFLIIVFPFLVNLVRVSLYPVLEKGYQANPFTENQVPDFYQGPNQAMRNDYQQTIPNAPAEDIAMLQEMQDEVEVENVAPSGRGFGIGSLSKSMPMKKIKRQKKLTQYDPNLVAQTGQGLPSWQWQEHRLYWDGPVKEKEAVRLWITPPFVNQLLGFLASLGWLCILYMIFRGKQKGAPKSPDESILQMTKKYFFKSLVLLALFPFDQAKADFPSQPLLDQLRAKLTEAPPCNPCGYLESALIETRPGRLEMTLKVHTELDGFFPIPKASSGFFLDEVFKNEQRVEFFYSKSLSETNVFLTKGTHTLRVLAFLYGDEIKIHFITPPKILESQGDGFEVSGTLDGKLRGNYLYLTAQTEAEPEEKAPLKETLKQIILDPTFLVERTLNFDKEWDVHTEVTRLYQTSGADSITIDLLAGESVKSDDFLIKDGTVTLAFAPGESSKSYASALQIKETLTLKASPTQKHTERWILDISSLWHLKHEGLYPIISDQAYRWTPTWHPWPGETLTLNLTKPSGAPGKHVSIERSTLSLNPGHSRTTGKLEIHLRASKGGRHTITFPKGFDLSGFKIDAKPQSTKLKDHRLTFPIHPGTNLLEIEFYEEEGLPYFYRTPVFELGTTHLNSTIQVKANSRWPLFLGGPRVGPVVLFWGELLVLLIFSIALGRLKIGPLKTHHWILLSLGASSVSFVSTVFLGLWFVVVAARERYGEKLSDPWLNACQVVLALFTFFTLIIIYDILSQGLLRSPDMGIQGVASRSDLYQWFQDRSPSAYPSAWILSLPLIFYRVAMLCWAIWFALAMIKWSQWFWQAFQKGGLFRKWQRPKKIKPKANQKPSKETPSEAPEPPPTPEQ